MAITLDGTNGINSSGVIVAPDGSASAPAITNDADTNTGIFFPAADTIAFAEGGVERMRIDSSGNVGIGTSSPSARLDATRGQSTSGLAGVVASPQFSLTNNTNWGYPTGMLFRAPLDNNGPVINNASIWAEWSGTNNAYLGFATTGSGTLTERARITSDGDLLVGKNNTTFSNVGTQINSTGQQFNTFTASDSGGAGLYINRLNVDGTAILFYKGTSPVGNIAVTTSATSYNTSSDYRLKENIAPMTGALDTVEQLNPVTYNWKADGSASQGFIAHELAAVVPDCVTGDKDAVDADGNPQYQGVDTSFLVATLTAAIQELKAINDAQASRIETLEAKVAALEANNV